MKFGRTLEKSIYPPWRQSYIDYGKLKKLLRDDDSAANSPSTATVDEWTDEDESTFVDELVNIQLEKVHQFHQETYEKLRDRTAKCEAKLDNIAVAANGVEENDTAKAQGEENGSGSGNGKKPVPSQTEKEMIFKEVLSELDQITKETNELEKYSRINYTGFLKAVKKHDRKRGGAYRVRPLLQVRLAALPFNKENYEPLLFRLSAMYSFVREHMDVPDTKSQIAEAQAGKEGYVSHKFWVHPENVLEVKTMILRRLPVLVYNPQTLKVAEGYQPDLAMTSLYFDNSAFSLYTNKVEHNAGSSFRLRWYGQLSRRPEIWIEKKTVDEDGTSHDSRLNTKEKYVQGFINGDYHMDKQIRKLGERAGPDSSDVRSMNASVDETQSFLKEYNLQPVLRANYARTAFQIPGDDRVRISLDTDLAFIREDAIDADRPCRDLETWHRSDIDDNGLEFPFTSIRKGEISRFPFAVLEVKMRTTPGKRTAEWVEDIMNSHLVKEAPRFSKFVHGVAQLFEDYVNTFPFWLSQMETDIRRDPQEAFEEEIAKRQKEEDDQFKVGSLLKSKSSMSPMQRGAMISPVGTPLLKGSVNREQMSQSIQSRLESGDVSNEHLQEDDVAEEPDEDETGHQAHDTARLVTSGGLATLFPRFSASKYARARPDTKRLLPPGVSEPEFWIKDQGPVKVEGKVWLANQRTFIKWQHVSILLASLSLGLFNAAGRENDVARALGVVYTVVAVFTAIWGYGVYMWRISLIQKRSGKDFDAVTGPIVVCIGLIIALILNFSFKVSLLSLLQIPKGQAGTNRRLSIMPRFKSVRG